MKDSFLLNEDHAALLAKELGGKRVGLPEDLNKMISAYCSSYGELPEELNEFLIVDGEFRVDRAARRIAISSRDISSQMNFYCGEKGWKKSQTADGSYTLGVNYYGTTIRKRVTKFDIVLDYAKENNKIVEVITRIVDDFDLFGRLNTNCRMGIIGWLIKNDLHHNESILEQFLRGYFPAEDKVQIMNELIYDNKLDLLEVFWKSKAKRVKILLIERAPIDKLPFLLDTKDKDILRIIEKKLEAK